MASPADDELRLPYARLEGVDFSGRRLTVIDIGPGSRLVRCDFSRIRATSGGLGGGLEPTEFVECSFDGASLKHVLPGRATFRGCSFRDITIFKFICHEAEFIDCVFTGRLRQVIFDAAPLNTEKLGRSRNEYRGNDFSGARLEDVAFRGGIDLDQQRLPDGPDYVLIRNVVTAANRAWDEEIATWSDQEARDGLNGALGILADDGRRGQRDVFVERSFLVKKLLDRNTDAADRLIAVLTRK